MGVVSPIGVGVEDFFAGLRAGRSGIGPVSVFDARGFPTRIAAEVRGPLPDLEGYAGPLAIALGRDRKSRFGLAAAREAVKMAFGSLSPDGCARRIGLAAAAGLELFDVRDLVRHVGESGLDGHAFLAELEQAARHAVGAVPADVGARVIREETGAEGPYSVNLSACAAGTQALGEAFLTIREGYAEAMIAGGYDSMINPLGLGGFCLLEAMTRQNALGPLASRPFAVSRDGFVLGEGAAFFVLEERGRARGRGARLLGEIEGYGCSLDAYRVTDPHPEGRGAITAMTRAMSMAGDGPGDLDYVNAHGTGTPKNDPAEARALRETLGADIERILVSSTKSQVGHLIGAAGAVEFAACLFALAHATVPATISLEQPDPQCALRHVPRSPVSATVRRVLSNSFGFGGQNASILVSAPTP